MPSVLFDAVYVPGGPASAAALKGSGDAVHFVREAFKHAKPIAASGDGVGFLVAAGVLATPDQKVAGISAAVPAAVGGLATAFIADIAQHRHWNRVAKDSMAA
jgi:catalase